MKWNFRWVFLMIPFSFISCESFFNEDISNENVIIIAPVSSSVLDTNPIFFDWEEVEFATDYKLQIATPSFANASQLVADTIIRSTSYNQELLPADYEWRIKARNAEFETIYEVNDFRSTSNALFANKIVVLENPTDNNTSNNGDVLFQWQNVDDAIEYRFQIENENGLVVDRNLNNLSIREFLADGVFTWRVRATNGGENTAYSSSTFTIDSQAPAAPTLTMPGDGSIQLRATIDFSWNTTVDSGTIQTDRIFVYNDVALSNLEFEEDANGNQSHTATLSSGNTYYWRVRTTDAAGNRSNFSNVFSFTLN